MSWQENRRTGLHVGGYREKTVVLKGWRSFSVIPPPPATEKETTNRFQGQ